MVKMDFDSDVANLELSDKMKSLIGEFLAIECTPCYKVTPHKAAELRKIILKEVEIALVNHALHSHDKEGKGRIPVWERIYIVATWRRRKIRHLLISLAQFIRRSYKVQQY